MKLPEYILSGPLIANPIESKMLQVRQQKLESKDESPTKKDKNKNANATGNSFSEYFDMVAQQMRPDKISQNRQRRQWRTDFIHNHYDPHQCWNLTLELKQYRKADREFQNVLGRSKKHR